MDGLTLILFGHILVPVLGILYLGIRAERIKQERMLRNSIKALGLIAVKTGNGKKLNS